jgi:ribonucleotide reductase alpha subunit
MSENYERFQYISKDLDFLDNDAIWESIKKDGWMEVASNLGYDINQYQNQILAGRMLLFSLLDERPRTVRQYLTKIEHRLQPEIVAFMYHSEDQINELEKESVKYYLKHDWLSANSLVKSYLTKDIETPFFLWLRVASAMWYLDGWEKVKQTLIDLLSNKYIPASPTIFNAGFKNGQMSSCFLLTIEDNLESILYNGVGDVGIISKNNGGIGMDISRLRHSKIGYAGESKGLVSWVYLFNALIRAVDQGGTRKGACTLYCRAHHIDIMEFCQVSLKTGDHYVRAHDINTAIWFPNIFWERVKNNQNWTLFCPAITPLLNDVCGDIWEKQYIKYEQDPLIVKKKVISARKLLDHIIEIQVQSGMPYILHADACNFKSNQKNL